jgi:hypothetical protein
MHVREKLSVPGTLAPRRIFLSLDIFSAVCLLRETGWDTLLSQSHCYPNSIVVIIPLLRSRCYRVSNAFLVEEIMTI